MPNEFLLIRIHWDKRKVERELNKALGEDIVPQLRKLIEKSAHKIAKKYEPDSLLAEDAAADILLNNLINFLALSEMDMPECNVKRHQMTPEMVKWWQLPPE